VVSRLAIAFDKVANFLAVLEQRDAMLQIVKRHWICHR
jgi:hypothetical protein